MGCMGEVPSAGALGPEGATLRLLGYGILALPFLSFMISSLWLGRKSAKASAWTATAFMGLTLALATALGLGYHAQVLSRPDAFPARSAMLWEHTWMAFALEPGSALAARFGF